MDLHTLDPTVEQARLRLVLTESGELARVRDWHSTRYWGERVWMVEDATGICFQRDASALVVVDEEMLAMSVDIPKHWLGSFHSPRSLLLQTSS